MAQWHGKESLCVIIPVNSSTPQSGELCLLTGWPRVAAPPIWWTTLAKELEVRNGRWTALGWFVLVACTSVCAFAPAAGAEEGAPMGSAEAEALMVGDYLSYFNIPSPYGTPSYTIMTKLLEYI